MGEALFRDATEMTEPQLSWLHSLAATLMDLGSVPNAFHSTPFLIFSVPPQPLFPPTSFMLPGSDEKKRSISLTPSQSETVTVVTFEVEAGTEPFT